MPELSGVSSIVGWLWCCDGNSEEANRVGCVGDLVEEKEQMEDGQEYGMEEGSVTGTKGGNVQLLAIPD